MATTRIAELSSLIAINTANIDEHLARNGLPSPSFEPSGTSLSDEKIAASRQIILEATDELHALMLGPAGILTNPSVCVPPISKHADGLHRTIH